MLDEFTIAAIAQTESNFNPNAVSPAGAQGLMQIMPANARKLAPGKDIFDPDTNMETGVKLLQEEYDRFGDLKLALAAYNAGSPAVKRAMQKATDAGYGNSWEEVAPFLTAKDGKTPLFETINYVPKVLARREEYLKKYGQTAAATSLNPYREDKVGTIGEFKDAVTKIVTHPDFAELPARDRIKQLREVYGATRWNDAEVRPALKVIADQIWEAAPQDAPDFGSSISLPGAFDKLEDIPPAVLTAKQEVTKQLEDSNFPVELLGSNYDKYFEELEKEHTDRFTARNRGLLGDIGAGSKEVARGALTSYTQSVAAPFNLLGYEETGRSISEFPESVFGTLDRRLYFQRNEDGSVKTDEYGKPVMRDLGPALSAIGQGVGLLGGGAALHAAKVGVGAVAGFFGTVNTASIMNDTFESVRDGGGSYQDSLTAAFAAIPLAAMDTVVDTAIVGSGQYWLKGLTGPASKAIKARALTRVAMLKGGTEGATEFGQEGAQQLIELTALGKDISTEFDWQRQRAAAIGGAFAGGIVGTISQAPDVVTRINALREAQGLGPLKAATAPTTQGPAQSTSSFPQLPPGLPAPYSQWIPPVGLSYVKVKNQDSTSIVQLGTLPAPDDQKALAAEFERFQQSPEQYKIITLKEGEVLPPMLPEEFGFSAKRISPTEIAIIKETETDYTALPHDTPEQIEQKIEALQKELVDSPDIEELPKLTDDLRTNQKQARKLEKYLVENPEAPSGLMELYNDTKRRIRENRAERRKLGDKMLHQINDEEFQGLQEQLNQIEESLNRTPQLKKLTELKEEISQITKVVQRMQDPRYENTRSNARKALSDALAARKKLVADMNKTVSQDNPELQRAGALVVKTKRGKWSVLPYGDGYYVFDQNGIVASDRLATPRKAVDYARQMAEVGKPRLKATESMFDRAGYKQYLESLGKPTKPQRGRRKKQPVQPEGPTLPPGGTESDAVDMAMGGTGSSLRQQDRLFSSPGGRFVKAQISPRDLKRPAGISSAIANVQKVISMLPGGPLSLSFGGRMVSGAAGYFSGIGEFIKVNVENNLPTAIHETVHAIQNRLFDRIKIDADSSAALGFSRKDKTYPFPPNILEALRDQARVTYPPMDRASPYYDDKLLNEGMAMFIENLATGNSVNIELLEWFNTDFAQQFPQEHAMMRMLVDAGHQFYSSTPEEIMTDFRSAEMKPSPLKRVLNYFKWSNLITEWDDSKYALAKLDKVTNSKFRVKDVADSFANTAVGYAQEILENNIRDTAGNIVEEGGLLDPFERMQKAGKLEKLINYMVAMNFKYNYLNQGKESGVPQEIIDKLLGDVQGDPNVAMHELAVKLQEDMTDIELNDPEVFHAAHDYWSKWDKWTDALVKAGDMEGDVTDKNVRLYTPLPRRYWQGMREINRITTGATHGYYLPVQREGKTDSDFLLTRTGSYRRIANPIEVIKRRVIGVSADTHKKTVMDRLVRIAEDPTNVAGAYVRKVGETKARKLDKKMQEHIGKVAPDVLTADLSKDMKGAFDAFIRDNSSYFAPQILSEGAPDGFINMMTEAEDGSRHYYEVSTEVFDTLAVKMPDITNRMWYEYGVKLPKDVLRASATSARPAFAVPNILRDIPMAWLTYPSANPFLFAWDIMNGLRQAALSTMGLKQLSGWAARMEALGASGATRLGHDKSERILKEGFSSGQKVLDMTFNTVGGLFSALENTISVGERGIRLAPTIRRAKQLGLKPDDNLTPEQAVELMTTFKRSTIDFSAQGTRARAINTAYPFFTANIAAVTQTARAVMRQPGKAAATAAGWLGVGLAYALAYRDEEWYKELDVTELAQFMYFPVIGASGQEMLLRFPLGEWGSMFFMYGNAVGSKTNPEDLDPRAYEFMLQAFRGAMPIGGAVIGDDPEFKNVGSLLNFGGPLVKEIVQQYANKDYFTGKPIVSKALSAQGPRDQVSSFTTSGAQGLAEAIYDVLGYEWSPVRIDHFIKSLSPVTMDAVKAYEDMTGRKPAKMGDVDKRLIDYFATPFFRYGAVNSMMDKSGKKFYDALSTYQNNQSRETEQEKTIRVQMEKVNRGLGAINTILMTDAPKEDRAKLLQQKRQLLTIGRRLAKGEMVPIPASPEYAAKQIKEQKRRETAAKRTEKQITLPDRFSAQP